MYHKFSTLKQCFFVSVHTIKTNNVQSKRATTATTTTTKNRHQQSNSFFSSLNAMNDELQNSLGNLYLAFSRSSIPSLMLKLFALSFNFTSYPTLSCAHLASSISQFIKYKVCIWTRLADTDKKLKWYTIIRCDAGVKQSECMRLCVNVCIGSVG